MAIKHALLALLSKQSNSASGLQQAFHDLFDSTQPLNIGQVSQTLHRLERDGLISDTGPVARPTGHQTSQYCLTKVGTDALKQWWSAPVLSPLTDRDELVTKVTLAAVDETIDLIDILDTQRATILKQLRELNNQARNLPVERTASRLLIERRIFDLEAEARWLDRIEALSPPNYNPAEGKQS